MKKDDNVGWGRGDTSASMRVSRRGARLTAASLKVTAGASFFEDNIGDTGGPLRDLRVAPPGRPAGSFIRKYYELTR